MHFQAIFFYVELKHFCGVISSLIEQTINLFINVDKYVTIILLDLFQFGEY